jgi:Raf kinase inhibitor-like YbhB/YbcL family protein
MAFTLTSPDFAPGGEIPAVHTCEGGDQSPALSWSGVPAAARSLALVADDPDAPDPRAPRTVWAHWLLYGLPPADGALARAVARAALPAGTQEGKNDFGLTGYGGPCPPIGRHRYFFRLHALDLVLPDLHQPSRAALLQAMRGHIIETAELMGTYQKHKQK